MNCQRGARGALVCGLVALVSSAGSHQASAQGTEAAAAFAKGKALFDARDLVGAIAAFERAYKLRPHHAVQCSIALCYEHLNRFVEAAEFYHRCLSEGADKTPRGEQVRKSLFAVEARLAWVKVESPGKGGTIYIDGVGRGLAPRRVPLDPGAHVIEVRREGAQTATTRLQTLSGEEHTVKLVPLELSVPASAPVVTSQPATRPVEAPSRRRLSPAWFWSGVGLTVATGVAAAVMGGLTYKAHSEYYDAPTEDGYNTFVQRRLITNILTGVAVAAAGTSLVLFFYTDFKGRRHETEGTEVSLGVVGTF
jgi:hypothetical protein